MYSKKPVLIVAPEWERSVLKNILLSSEVSQVIRETSDSCSAIEIVNTSKVFFVFIELELTRGDGIELLKFLRDREDVKVVVVSRLLRYSSPILFEELEEFKPDMIIPMSTRGYEVNPLARALIEKIFSSNSIKNKIPLRSLKLKSRDFPQADGSVIIVGGSTGSLKPLYRFLQKIEINDNSSVVIALHTLKTEKNIEKIKRVFGPRVKEVQGIERFELGKVYILRSGRNYRLTIKNGNMYFKVFKSHLALGYRPSINLVMENLSAIFRERCTGVILSGYGSDGVLGSKIIAMRGGRIIIQDPENAKAPSMPSLAIEALRQYNKIYEVVKL